MGKKICIIFGHDNTKDSFNAHVRDVFIEEITRIGFDYDLVNLHDEQDPLPFYTTSKTPIPQKVLDYRKQLESSDILFLIGPCHNLRFPSILENWIDWVLQPSWFFTFKSILPGNKYFQNYGYAVPGHMKGKLGCVSISYGGPMISYFNFSVFDNIPYRRLKKAIFKLGGMKVKYLRFYSVLPTMTKAEFNGHMDKVRKFAQSLQ